MLRISRLFMIWMVLLALAPAALAQATLTIGSGSAPAGSVVEVNASLSSRVSVAAIQVDISFNAQTLTLTQILAGSSANAAGKEVSSRVIAAGTARVLVAGLNTNAIPDGTLFVMRFRIETGASPGRYPIAPLQFTPTSPQGTAIASATAIAGFIEVLSQATTTTTSTTTSTRPTSTSTTTTSTTTSTRPTLTSTTTTTSTSSTRPSVTSTTLVRNQAYLLLANCGGAKGTILEVEVSLISTVPVSALQFDLAYDRNALSFVEASAGPSAVLAKKALSVGALSAASQRMLIAGLNKTVIANGVIAYLQFRLSVNAAAQKVPLSTSNFIAVSPQGENYRAVSVRSGSIEVIPPPVLDQLTPESGPPKSLIVLAGQNMGSCSSGARVTFTGTGNYLRTVKPSEATARRIAVEVPADAGGTLSVSVTIGGLSTNGLPFRVDTSRPFNSPATQIEESTSLGANVLPSAVDFDRRANIAYIADVLNGVLAAIDVESRSILSKVPVGSRPSGIAVNPITGQIVVSNSGSNNVFVLQGRIGKTPQLLAQIAVGRNPTGVAVNPITNKAVVANTDDNNVTMIDLNLLRAAGNISTGNQPTAVAIDYFRNRAFVTNAGDNTISILDLSAGRPIGMITGVGSQPRAAEFHQETGTLLVGSASGLYVRNIESGQWRLLLEGKTISDIILHPLRGLVVAISSLSGTVTAIDLSAVLSDPSKAIIGTIPLAAFRITGAAINPFTNQGILAHRPISPTHISEQENRGEQSGISGFARMSIPISLNFPRVLFNAGETLGIAISNPSTDAASLQLTAINASGQQLQGAGLLNPATILLPAQGQVASLDTQLFGDAAGSLGDFWFHVVAPNPDLKGFFLTGDFINSIVGTEENGAIFMDSILPSVRPGEENRFSIINPLPITTSVTMDLITNSGSILQSLVRSIPLYGMLQGRTQDFFSAYSQIGEGGYLRLRSVTGIRSYQQFVPVGRKDPAGLNAQSAVSGPSMLVFSHFVAGRDAGAGISYETRAGLINLETSGQSILLSIRDDQGNLLAAPQTLSLPASGRVDPELRALFSLSSNSLTQGWLKVEGTGRLAGYLTYSTGEAFAAVVSLIEPRNQLTFSQVAEEGTGFFTGLAVLNTNAESASISISVFDSDGLLTATTDSPYSIPPNGRIRGLLNQLVGPGVIGQSGGYVLVASSLPVHGIEIFGTSNGRAFANVPAQ